MAYLELHGAWVPHSQPCNGTLGMLPAFLRQIISPVTREYESHRACHDSLLFSFHPCPVERRAFQSAVQCFVPAVGTVCEAGFVSPRSFFPAGVTGIGVVPFLGHSLARAAADAQPA